MTKKERRDNSLMLRMGRVSRPCDESILAEREKLAQRIAACTVNGVLGVVESGMDCDCCQYTHSTTIENPTVMKVWQDREHRYEWADGSMGVSYCRPDELPGDHSRDLALEAFEDGHPHVVYA